MASAVKARICQILQTRSSVSNQQQQKQQQQQLVASTLHPRHYISRSSPTVDQPPPTSLFTIPSVFDTNENSDINQTSLMAFHTVFNPRGRTNTSPCPALPHELLVKVFEELLYPELAELEDLEQPKDLDEFLVGRRALVACSLVDRQWYYVATSILWRNPIFPSIKAFSGFLTALHPTIDPTNPVSVVRVAETQLPSAYPVGYSGRAFVRTLKLSLASNILCTELDLSMPKFIRDDHVTALAQLSFSSLAGEDSMPCFPNLTTLSLAGCENVTDMPVIELVAQHARTLNSVDLSGCRLITDMAVQFISNLCGSRLEELNLRNCGLVSDAGVKEIAASCSVLKRLDIGWCRRVSDRSLRALAPMQLEELSIVGCRAVTMTGLVNFAAAGSQNLLRFDISSPAFPQTSQIQPVHQLTALLESLPTTLRSLAILQAGNLSINHISLIAQRFPSLTSLTLENFRDLSDESFEILGKLPLEELRLPSCRRVDDCCLRILAASSQAATLRVLDLSNCIDISDSALLRLAGIASQNPTKTLRASFLNASSPFPKLHTLLLTNNRRLTIRGLVPAVRSLPSLRYLDLSGTGEGIIEPLRADAVRHPGTFGFRQLLQLHTSPRNTTAPANCMLNQERPPLVTEVGDILGKGGLEMHSKKSICVVRGWSSCEKVRGFDLDGLTA